MTPYTELLNDPYYLLELLNGPCRLSAFEKDSSPINPNWIDPIASKRVTEAFHGLLPGPMPYATQVLVEKNPDTLYGGVCVDDNTKRQRYFLVTIIPDAEYPYNYSYPYILQSWIVSLICWENVRAALKACTRDMQVILSENPVPPILNNARVEWVSLYLGREPYAGIQRLSEQCEQSDSTGIYNLDVNLYKVREMEADPLLTRLIEAYDEQFPKLKEEPNEIGH